MAKHSKKKTGQFARYSWSDAFRPMRLLLAATLLLTTSLFLIPSLMLSHTSLAGVVAFDIFSRGGGELGPDWTATSGGGMAISSQEVTGTGAITGDISTAMSYPSSQYSEVEVASTPLTGREWIGSAVRLQDGGQDGYVGIYYWNFGNPQLRLYKRTAGRWTQLGDSYDTGRLTAGTRLDVVAVDDTISFMEDRVPRISVTDRSFTGGAAGIMARGNAAADNWSGGAASFVLGSYGTGAHNVESYEFISVNDGGSPQILRVLTPANPTPGIARNFLIVLPVEAGVGITYGDGIGTMQAIDAQDKYDLTIIEPSFSIDPWYANSATDPDIQYETFMTQELVPFIKQSLETRANEQIWLIGFSKSGLGAQDLILKHPGVFTLAASWDFPADMSSYNQYGAAANYGTNENFQANYRLTPSFLAAHKGAFTRNDRIWIGGYQLYGSDVSDYNALLTSEGIDHNTEMPRMMAHRWDSGWVPIALEALYEDSIHLHLSQ